NQSLFNLALLGIGSDGHTASLFPDSPVLTNSKDYAAAAGKGPEGWERVSLTYKAFNKVSQIWFMASGKDKQDAVKQLINGPWEPVKCPAQAIGTKGIKPILWVDFPVTDA
ncbi:MAG: 6-phosphogluconolactonase, partial [Planctomycetes bacterium]|nr:6-phosphogluconolactonase [Planctomycetota bacterium]